MFRLQTASERSTAGGQAQCEQVFENIPKRMSSQSVEQALPLWQDHMEPTSCREYIFNYHTVACQQLSHGGSCQRQRGRSSFQQCSCFHFAAQRRRSVVDPQTNRLLYWDVLCDAASRDGECPLGDRCLFAHTRDEISYHAAKYKTKLCNDRYCRGPEVCCFAHGAHELRPHAMDLYSFWNLVGKTSGGLHRPPTPPAQHVPPSRGGAGQEECFRAVQRDSANDAAFQPRVQKYRFCASYPNVSSCRRGELCAFAHTREEIKTPLLTEDEENQKVSAFTNEFFMMRFKTLWCPIGVQHDWQSCVYAHNYQDARRNPDIGYGPSPCPNWKRKETTLDYAKRCPLGVRCPFSHGAKEQLYHPANFKTVTCQDWPHSNCTRGKLCAFWHRRTQQRSRPTDDEFNYKSELSAAQMEALQPFFVSPPFQLFNGVGVQGDTCQPVDLAEPILNSQLPIQKAVSMPRASLTPSRERVRTLEVATVGSCGTPSTPTTADGDEAASTDSSVVYEEARYQNEDGRQWCSPQAQSGVHNPFPQMNQMMPAWTVDQLPLSPVPHQMMCYWQAMEPALCNLCNEAPVCVVEGLPELPYGGGHTLDTMQSSNRMLPPVEGRNVHEHDDVQEFGVSAQSSSSALHGQFLSYGNTSDLATDMEDEFRVEGAWPFEVDIPTRNGFVHFDGFHRQRTRSSSF